MAKAVYDMPTTRVLLDRLGTDVALRRICGWERRSEVPSESVFSRAFAEFAATQLAQRTHEALIRELSSSGHDRDRFSALASSAHHGGWNAMLARHGYGVIGACEPFDTVVPLRFAQSTAVRIECSVARTRFSVSYLLRESILRGYDAALVDLPYRIRQRRSPAMRSRFSCVPGSIPPICSPVSRVQVAVRAPRGGVPGASRCTAFRGFAGPARISLMSIRRSPNQTRAIHFSRSCEVRSRCRLFVQALPRSAVRFRVPPSLYWQPERAASPAHSTGTGWRGWRSFSGGLVPRVHCASGSTSTVSSRALRGHVRRGRFPTAGRPVCSSTPMRWLRWSPTFMRPDWEAYAITARPAGPGRSVQQQTQRWLQRHGAGELSVVLDPGNRAAVASALALDWLVDDYLESCSATALETDARAIWIAPRPTPDALRQAEASGCAHAFGLAEAVALIEQS